MDIWDKLKKLRDKYPDEESTEMLRDYDKRIKKSILVGNLLDHDGFKILLGRYSGEVESINKELTTNSALFKDAEGMTLGRLLHERKKWCLDFLKIFDAARQGLAGMEEFIDNKLNQE